MFLLVPAHPGCPGQNPKSRKMVVCVCVCSMLHGSETWPVRKENKVALQRAEMRTVR